MAPTRPARDVRLDVLRGWMQLSIFISHAGTAGFVWLIHANWGASDSSEQFMLLSGITLGSVFTLKRVRDGFAAAMADMRRRALGLWRRHLLVFIAFGTMVVVASTIPGSLVDPTEHGWCWVLREPWFAVPAAALLLHTPPFMDILPIFVLCMLVLPGFVWLLERFGDRALILPFGLYGLSQMGVEVPSLGPTASGFAPLAWQLLFLFGVWIGRRTLLGAPNLPRPAWLWRVAVAVLLLGAWVRLGQLGVAPAAPEALVALVHKPSLAPLRLLHALLLAWLVVQLLPAPGPWLETAPARLLAMIGRNSLDVFCAGLFLSWILATLFGALPEHGLAIELLGIPAGVALLSGLAWYVGRPKPAPAYKLATARSQ